MSLQIYYTFVGPALVVLAGAMILGISWLFTRDRHPKAPQEPPQSTLQTLVEAGGAVSDGTGLSAAAAGKGRWRRWLRSQ